MYMDDGTQSTSNGPLSEISTNSQDALSTRDEPISFRKDAWLVQYFSQTKRNGQTRVMCRGCNETFASRSHARMKVHLKSCKKIEGDGQHVELINNDLKTTDSITASILARLLVVAGWSLRGIERKEFKEFVRRLDSRYKPPTRKEISAIYIPRLSMQLHEKFKQSLSLGANSVSIEFDHWRDAVGKSYLGVIATCNSGEDNDYGQKLLKDWKRRNVAENVRKFRERKRNESRQL